VDTDDTKRPFQERLTNACCAGQNFISLQLRHGRVLVDERRSNAMQDHQQAGSQNSGYATL